MMNYYSTRDHSFKFPFEHAIYMGPAPDGGLFMPEIVPLVSKHFIETIEQNALREIAFEILRPYISMPDVDLQKILFNAFSFPA
ncbi:MAG TPA: hypothetical protein PKK99_09060, partial [Bacteroidia bacterium]|nr:hypothetical protein [Bacteroidia bacterium]